MNPLKGFLSLILLIIIQITSINAFFGFDDSRFLQGTNNTTNPSNTNNTNTTTNNGTNETEIIPPEEVITTSEKEMIAYYQNIYNPNNRAYQPINFTFPDNPKPSRLIVEKEEVTTRVVGNSRVSKSDYEYTGPGLGNGVIAIICFIVVGIIVCIAGTATEYSL